MTPDIYDAIILGGGPAGATAARSLALAGFSTVILDRATFPRFHIGESFLPRTLQLLHELGLAERIAAVPQVEKLGAEFVLPNGDSLVSFFFDTGLAHEWGAESKAFNIERAPYDAALLDAAREAGVEVREETPVKSVLRLADGDVAVAVEGGEVRGRYLLDASGQGTIVGRHLGLRRVLPHLRKVAYFSQFTNVERESGPRGGFPVIVPCVEGWFWLIPLDEERTSIGLVLDAEAARRTGVAPESMLAWGISRCPVVREKTARAVATDTNRVNADFSYRCEPYAGPGYFLVGDAATFVDPIFSTGVCLGMMSAVAAAGAVGRLLRGEERPAAARRRYIRFVTGSTRPFFRLVSLYYDRSFRDLFMSGSGPLGIHRAVISLLAGHAFPRPRFAIRWRMWAFEIAIALNRLVPLGPRHRPYSLLDGAGLAPAPPPSAPSAGEAAAGGHARP